MRRFFSFFDSRFSILITLAIVLRLVLIPNPGFEADVSFWKSWGLATVDFGIVEGLNVTNNNYPTPFAYTLGALVWIYKLFADPHNFNVFWKNTNLIFLAISKALPIIADIGIAGIIMYIGKNAKKLGFPQLPITNYQLLSLAYLLNPVSLIDGAWWGQVDSLGVFMFLLALLALLKAKNFLAGFLFILAMMTKLQNMIYGPLFFLFIWQTTGFQGLIQAIAGATLGFFGLNIEFLMTKNMDRVLGSLTDNYDYFPWMSLHAYNLWWIVTGAKGMVTSDKLTMIGMVNAKTIGLLLFSSFYLFAVLRQILKAIEDKIFVKLKMARGGVSLRRIVIALTPRMKWKGNDLNPDDTRTRNTDLSATLRTFLENLIIVNAAFFLFQTQSHDRYAFPLIVFLLLWSSYIKQKKWFFLFYTVFSLFYFYNLHTALVINYPHNGLPFLSSLIQPFFTITTAIVLIGLFGTFLMRLHHWMFPLGVAAIGIVILNIPLITKQSISLTTFTPYISEQAYGQRQTNRSVQSSFGGPFKWTRLSVQYLFYDKGIGTHAASRHVFDINRKFKRMTTDFGIDTEAGTKASAVFEIYGDGKLLFRSEKIGRFDLPRHAEVDITGIKFLTLVTTDAGDGNYDDHTDWLNPTLYP